MKHFILFLLSLVLFAGCKTGKKETQEVVKTTLTTNNPVKYAETITATELKEMLYTYASDEFEGRETGKNGQKLAVNYLKSQYMEMDIPSPLGKNNYFQNVPLSKQKPTEADIKINGKKYKSFNDQIVLLLSESVNFNADEIVYVGYGIDSEKYSNYNNVDVAGKIVLAKAGEPKNAEGNFITTGSEEPTKWTNGRQAIASKRTAAIDKGARGLILIDNDLLNVYAPYYKRYVNSGESGRVNLKTNDGPFFMILANDILGKAIYADLDTDDSSKPVKTNLQLNIEDKSDELNSENVLAFIKGSEKPDEILVLSAHLDHEGIKNGEIYNGADDDGSGTVAILEIAEAFKMAEKEGKGPKRSILFLHVTGEEKGLLGSRHYTDNNPIFPLENTVANLNIDMIGRTDPKRKTGSRNYIYLIGSDKLSKDLHNLSEQVNEKYCNMEFDYTFNDDNDPNRFYYRSDHYNFAKNNIPIIFYFNGTHDDYHQPTDTPDKIEYDLLENRTRLIFYTAWEIANRNQRIVVD